MTYEHPSHKAARDARAVPPVIDLTGWDKPAPKQPKSSPGQLPLPGCECVRQGPHYKTKWLLGGEYRKRRF